MTLCDIHCCNKLHRLTFTKAAICLVNIFCGSFGIPDLSLVASQACLISIYQDLWFRKDILPWGLRNFLIRALWVHDNEVNPRLPGCTPAFLFLFMSFLLASQMLSCFPSMNDDVYTIRDIINECSYIKIIFLGKNPALLTICLFVLVPRW